MLLKQIILLYQVLINVKDKEMPIALSYKFAKILTKITEEYNYYIQNMRKIANKYGVKNEAGQLQFTDNGDVQINTEQIDNANKEILALENLEVMDIPRISFSLEELSSLTFSPAEIQILMPFLTEE